MKILVLGYSRHGKDTVAEYISGKYGLTLSSATHMAAELFIYDALKDKYGYNSIDSCVLDRTNHRQEWFDLFNDYCKDDETRFIREVLQKSDIYVGLREKTQILKAISEKLFDIIIWVDASDRLPVDKTAFTVTPDIADHIVDNNDTLEECFNCVDVIFSDKLTNNMDFN